MVCSWLAGHFALDMCSFRHFLVFRYVLFQVFSFISILKQICYYLYNYFQYHNSKPTLFFLLFVIIILIIIFIIIIIPGYKHQVYGSVQLVLLWATT